MGEPDPDKPRTWPDGWAPGWNVRPPPSWRLDVYLFQRLHGLPADGLEGPVTKAAGFMRREFPPQ